MTTVPAHAVNEKNMRAMAEINLLTTVAPVGCAALISLLGVLNDLRAIARIVKEVDGISGKEKGSE